MCISRRLLSLHYTTLLEPAHAPPRPRPRDEAFDCNLLAAITRSPLTAHRSLLTAHRSPLTLLLGWIGQDVQKAILQQKTKQPPIDIDDSIAVDKTEQNKKQIAAQAPE